MPASAAVVAAPIQKLCPAYLHIGKPNDWKRLNCLTNVDFVRAVHGVVIKNTPGDDPLIRKYWQIAITGQTLVRPTTMSAP